MLKCREEYTEKIRDGKKVKAIKKVYYNEAGLTDAQKKKHDDKIKAFEAEKKKIEAAKKK